MPPPVPLLRIAGGVAPRTDRAALPNPNVPISDSVRRAATQLGADVQAVTNQILEDARAADLVNAEKAFGNFQREAQERIAKLDPLSKTYLQDLQKAYSDARTNAVSTAGLSTPEVLQALERRVTQISETAATVAAGKRRTAVAREAKKVRANARTALVNQIRDDPDAAELFLQTHQKTTVQATTPALINVNEAEKEDRADLDAATEATVQGHAENGNFKAANEVASSVEKESPEKAAALKRTVKSAQINAEIAKNLTTGSLIDRLQTAADLADERIPDQVSRALKAKVISKREANSINKRFQKALRAKIEQDRVADQGAAAIAKGLGTTQEEADALYARARDTIANAPDETEALLNFIRQVKRAPTPIKEAIKRNEERGQPAALVQNAQLLQVLTNGDVGIEEFGIRSRLTFEFARLNGVTFEEAARAVVEGAPENEQEEKRRLRDVKKPLQEGIAADLESIWEGAPPPNLAARYAEAVEAGFLVTGDLETARQTALRKFKAEYGTSEINATSGVETQMRYPPEQVALLQPRFKGADPDALTEEVQAFMNKRLLEVAREAVGDPNAKNLNVTPVTDEETIRAIRAGDEPTWAIRITRGGQIFTLRTRIGLPSPQEQQAIVRDELAIRRAVRDFFGGEETDFFGNPQ